MGTYTELKREHCYSKIHCMMLNEHYDGIDAVYKLLNPLGAMRDVPMKNHTSFRIGGIADILFSPKDENELQYAIQTAITNEIPYHIMGAGSNVLVADSGIRGLVIRLCSTCDENVEFNKCGDTTFVTLPAQMMLSRAAKLIANNGLCGFEWAYGIPGTVGGAVAMNAGAYGGEMKQVLSRVRILSNGEIADCDVCDSDMSYRYSRFAFPDAIVLGATLALNTDDGNAWDRMNDYMSRRKLKQPLDLPSAGSVFKRPPGHFAGALIEGAGLKGRRVGGAQVSSLHAGFIVNDGNATADDVLELIALIKECVFRETGIMLEEELKMLG